MSYFSKFPQINYNINNINYLMTNIVSYVDINVAGGDSMDFYSFYTIPDGYRPDNVSYELYGTEEYYWTFFLINSDLKDYYTHWPKKESSMYDYTKKLYPGQGVKVSEADIHKLNINDSITDQSTGTKTGTVIGVYPTSLWIHIKGDTFTTNDIIVNATQSITPLSINDAAIAPHHYISNSTNDIVMYNDGDTGKTPVTNYDFEIETNLARSNIRVIKPALVFDVIKEFNKELVKQIA